MVFAEQGRRINECLHPSYNVATLFSCEEHVVVYLPSDHVNDLIGIDNECCDADMDGRHE